MLVSVIGKTRERTDRDTGVTRVITLHTVTKHVDIKGKNKIDKVKKASGTSGDPDEEVEHSFAFEINAHVSERAIGKLNDLLVGCGATTHIINDESKFNKFNDNFTPDKHYIELADGTGSNNVALKRGDVEITIMDITGKLVNASLKDALYIPTYPQNI